VSHTGGRLIHGTSSWSAPGWVGPFYPPGTRPGAFLEHYAQVFPAVEADVTYYRVPDQRLVGGWCEKTPEDFVICAKFPRTVVHGGASALPNADAVLEGAEAQRDGQAFTRAMAGLGPRLGPVVLQFPYFRRELFNSASPFLERLERFLAARPAGQRVAVEVRNPRWIAAPLLELLRRNGAALVLCDLPYVPHGDELARELGGPEALLTADYAYIRLIGDRKAVEAHTKTFDRVVVDRTDRLERWAALIAGLLERVPQVYAFANNHFAGHGPTTAGELAARVEGLRPGSTT
jgi:uncharacterized protein YecE (DUF72 family)